MKKLYEIHYYEKGTDKWCQCDAEGALVIGHHEALVIAENDNPDCENFYYTIEEVYWPTYLSVNGIIGNSIEMLNDIKIYNKPEMSLADYIIQRLSER